MRVPVANNFSESPSIAPGIRLNAPQVSNAAAEQIQQVGNVVQQGAQGLARIQTDILQDANRLRLDEAMTQAQQARLIRMQEVKALKGKDALYRGDKPLDEEYDNLLNQDLEAIGKTLGNDAQKQAWALESGAMRRQFRSEVAGHMAAEHKTYDDQVQHGKISTGLQLMQQSYDNPNDWDTARGVISDAVARLNAGSPPEYLKAETVKALTPGHVSVVQSMLQGNQVQAARDYFARPDVQDELTPEARARLSGVLTASVNDMEGQQAAREVIATNPGASMKELDSELVARFGNNPAVLEVARREVKYQRDLEETSKRETESSLMRPVDSLLGDARLGGQAISRNQASAVLAPLKLSNPDAYAKATALIDAHNDEIRNERQAAEDRARSAHERALRDGAKGDEASTSAWYTLKTNPSALRVTDLLTLRTKGILSEKHFNDLVGDKKSLMEKRTSDENILSDKAAVDMVLNAAKIDTGKDGDPAKLALFYERFNQRVREAGKQLDQAGKVAIARELLGEVVKERSYWFDTTQRAFEVAVPPADRAQIIAALRRSGKPITETNIVNLYQAGQKK